MIRLDKFLADSGVGTRTDVKNESARDELR